MHSIQQRILGGVALLCVTLYPPLSGAADALALQLLAGLAEVKTLSSDFHQKVHDEHGKVIARSRGQFVFQRPGKFRWDYVHPFEQTIVADGEDIWVHDLDLEQVTVRSQREALNGTPALLLSGGIDIDTYFEMGEFTQTGAIDWVQLLPKNKEGTFTELRLGFKHTVLARMEMRDHFNQSTYFLFKNVILNAVVAEEKFVFQPPKGVDIIGQ